MATTAPSQEDSPIAVSGGNFGFIGGGSGIEVVDSVYAASVGGYNNDITGSDYSVIGGGQNNYIEGGNKNFIGGGSLNTISGSQAIVSAILGGENNLITGLNSVLLGGNSNEILSNYSFIGGGEENITSGAFSAISAGEGNKTFGLHSIIAGGQENIASGTHSFIGGGHLNTASANYSYAFGRRSKVGIYDTGAAVFSDGRDEDSISSGAHTATLDFAGGVYVPTSGMFGEGLFVSGVPVLTGENNPPEADTLQSVTTRGNETTTSIISTGPYISGVTGLFSDKVGIGTDSPDHPLEVTGNIRGDSFTIGTDITYSNDLNITNAGKIRIGNAEFFSKSSNDLNIYQGRAYVTNDGDFYVDTDTLYTDAINDRVGVNTDSPEAALHVYSGDAIIGRVGSNSPNSTLTVAGYDNFGLDFRAHSSWTHWKARVGHGRNFELYNDGANNDSQTLQLGKTNATENASLLLFSTGVFMDVGRNSNYPLARFSVDAANALAGDLYVDIRSSTTVTDRFEFNRGGEFIASGIGIGYTSPNYELDVNGTGHFAYDLYIDADLDVRGDAYISGSVEGTGAGNRITNNGVPYLLSGDSPAETQTLQDVTDNGNTTTNDIIISGVLSIPSGRAVASEDVYYIVKLTQAEYDALTPDASTMYIITDEDFNSPVINPIKTVASNYIITDTDHTILVSGSSTVNITLPSATINSNYVYNIKNITTNSVVITPSAGYIDGEISKTINQKFESIATQSDGSNWYII